MAFNFTDELGFQEGQASPSDDLIIRTLDGGNITTTGSVKFTEHGVYAEQPAGSPFGNSLVFTPWSFIKYIQQNF